MSYQRCPRCGESGAPGYIGRPEQNYKEICLDSWHTQGQTPDPPCPNCERLQQEILRLKEELLIMAGILADEDESTGDTLPAKEKA